MTDFYTLPDESKRIAVEQTALKHGLSNQIIEKDLWVSTLLEIIFTLPFADKLVFKGGTSLSKVWGLIDRFSEDIDLAVDRILFVRILFVVLHLFLGGCCLESVRSRLSQRDPTTSADNPV